MQKHSTPFFGTRDKKVHYTVLTTDSNQFDAKISQWQANTLGFSERREAEAAALTG
jgi:hypothetical protein